MSAMDGAGFFALVEDAIGYVDERFGRVAAWALAVGVTLLPISALAFVMLR